MTAVLEDIARRHGCSTEAVDEDRLKFALEEVYREESADEGLETRRLRDGLVEVEVNERS